MAVTARDILSGLHAEDSLDPGEFPEEQNLGVVILLDQDKLLLRLVACWRNVPQSVLLLDAECPLDTPEPRRLRWLWAQLEPDPFARWISLAGLPSAPHIIEKCWVAVENKMVFPDGGLSRWARNYVNAKAARAQQ